MTPTTWGSRIGVAAAGVLLLGFGGVGAFALTGSLSDGRTAEVPAAAPTTGGLAAPAGVAAPSGHGAAGGSATADDSADTDEDESGTPKSGAVPTTAVGPDATGPAAHGLCTAWSRAKPSKRTASHSVAFRNLVAAAGGEGKVDAYCAALPRPSAGKGDKPSGHPKGKPSSHPGTGGHARSGKPSDAPGKPTTAPSRPTTAPGKPTTAPGSPSEAPGTQPTAPGTPSTAPGGAGTHGTVPAATPTA